MPELPEVETIRLTLMPRVAGQTVEEVVVRETRLRQKVKAEFGVQLTGRRFTALRRAGKYLLFDLDDGRILLVHLGMSGCLATSADRTDRHDHVVFRLSNGVIVTYNDPRRFGCMKIIEPGEGELSDLGVDPLSSDFTPEHLRELCRRRRRPIKTLLMDQALVAGVGNIYASEILFRAGVRPARGAHTLRGREIAAIHAATEEVLAEAIRWGGSSISDYRDGNGNRGGFQDRFRVYQRGGESCGRCGTTIRARPLGGRSSFYCPACQK